MFALNPLTAVYEEARDDPASPSLPPHLGRVSSKKLPATTRSPFLGFYVDPENPARTDLYPDITPG